MVFMVWAWSWSWCLICLPYRILRLAFALPRTPRALIINIYNSIARFLSCRLLPHFAFTPLHTPHALPYTCRNARTRLHPFAPCSARCPQRTLPAPRCRPWPFTLREMRGRARAGHGHQSSGQIDGRWCWWPAVGDYAGRPTSWCRRVWTAKCWTLQDIAVPVFAKFVNGGVWAVSATCFLMCGEQRRGARQPGAWRYATPYESTLAVNPFTYS